MSKKDTRQKGRSRKSRLVSFSDLTIQQIKIEAAQMRLMFPKSNLPKSKQLSKSTYSS